MGFVKYSEAKVEPVKRDEVPEWLQHKEDEEEAEDNDEGEE